MGDFMLLLAAERRHWCRPRLNIRWRSEQAAALDAVRNWVRGMSFSGWECGMPS
jgi:hypothetical protein